MKKCAAAWQMEDIMWMFSGSDDVDADCKMMLEIRDEVTEDHKTLDRVLTVQHSSKAFEKQCANLSLLAVKAKAGYFSR